MTLTDELKILDDKIKVNQAQYDLDRKAAKIFASSSKELDKCEYLTGEDLLSLITKKKVSTTKGLTLRDIKIWNLVLETIGL